MDCINEYLKENMKESRLRHTYNVRDMAEKLAGIYGADKTKAVRAAMYHDVCKSRMYTDQVLNDYVQKFGLDEKYINNSALSHSRIAAELMEKEWGIRDKDVIDAVRYHTTGRPGMSLLEKIIFIADATEAGREYAGVENIRETAFTDIDKACLMALENTIGYVVSAGGKLDEDSVRTRDWFLKTEKERENNG